MKHVFKQALAHARAGRRFAERKDKMGFPVPLQRVARGQAPCETSSTTCFSSDAARGRGADRQPQGARRARADEPRFGRKIWGLLCLELWQRAFHDREPTFKALADDEGGSNA